MRMLLVGCLMMFAACASKPVFAPPPPSPTVSVGQEFTLKVGDSVGIAHKAVKVAFKGVIEDSRCPMNARCIWEGNAKLALEITQYLEGPGDRPDKAFIDTHTAELNTSSRFSTGEKVGDVLIELRRLDPDRLAGAPTENYVATFFVQAD